MLQGSHSRRSFLGTSVRAAAAVALTSALPAQFQPGAKSANSLPIAHGFISNIRESTICTDSLEESIHYYREHFGFEVVRSTELRDPGWRKLWRLPPDAVAQAVLLQVKASEIGSIRLVQFSHSSRIYVRLPYRNLATGYGGMDMEVPDMTSRFQTFVLDGHARVNAPIQYEPPSSKLMLTESVVVGPTGERLPMVIYRDVAKKDEPMPSTPTYTPVLAVFQVVEDLEQEKEIYLRLGLEITRRRETSIPEVNRALGIPADTRYRAYQFGNVSDRFARPILVQFLNKTVENLSDISNPPNLGLLMTSFKVRDIQEAHSRLHGTPVTLVAGPVALENPLYGRTTALTFKQASGAWVELYA